MGDVSSPFEHPTLGLLVTEEQRERAVSFLQEAYAEGRLDELEFEDRMAQALVARTRKELNSSLGGLVLIPIPTASLAPQPARSAPSTAVARNKPDDGQNVASALVHLSPLVSLFFIPLITMLVADKGSRVRDEAKDALVFTASATGLLITLAMLARPDDTLLLGLLAIAVMAGWFCGVVAAGVRSAMGKKGFPFL